MGVGRLNSLPGQGFEHPVGGAEEAAQAAAPAPVAATAAAQRAAVEPGKLLTKKLAGEKVLLHHLGGRVGAKYEAKVIPGADREHYIVKLHRLSASPPFTVDANPEAVYTVDRR